MPEELAPSEDALAPIAMQIILHAGNARDDIRRAYEALARCAFEEVEGALQAARDDVKLAHQAQTALIQAEARGARHRPTLLFNHAQDTLMTVNSELISARQLVPVMAGLVSRVDALELGLFRAGAGSGER